MYYESMHSGDWPAPSGVPPGVAVFAEDIAIRRYAERANNIVHWSDFATGGPLPPPRKPHPLVPGGPPLFAFPAGLRAPEQGGRTAPRPPRAGPGPPPHPRPR